MVGPKRGPSHHAPPKYATALSQTPVFTLGDYGYGASVSRGAPVYVPGVKPYQIILLGDRSTCVNNLPKVVTWQCIGAELNLRLWITSGLQVLLPLDYRATLDITTFKLPSTGPTHGERVYQRAYNMGMDWGTAIRNGCIVGFKMWNGWGLRCWTQLVWDYNLNNDMEWMGK